MSRILRKALIIPAAFLGFLCHSEDLALPEKPLTRLTCYTSDSSNDLDIADQTGLQVRRFGAAGGYRYEVTLSNGQVWHCDSVVWTY